MSRERVTWAGTKDKHAVTTQLFTLRGVAPGELPAMDDADIEVVGRAGRGLRFGDLAGNAFEIRVREPDRPANADGVTADLAAFGGEPAVPNYFGHQRFGSRRPVTHEVGLALLREDWEAAVMAYLGDPSEREPADTREARRYVEEAQDWEGALDRFPARLGHERAMLSTLAGGGSFREALESAPTSLQSLFVNAAQSYAFNLVLSERLDRGLPFDRPVAGDVVCFAESVGGLTVPDADRTQRVTADRVDTVARHCERGRAFVAAPLVGTDTDFSGGDPGEIERSVVERLGVERADFDLPGAFGSTGTRRAVLVRADPEVERTDGDLRLSFSLPKGAYATTLLREYLKTDPEAL
jgi:tRNA pseudouridine13 synthase